jgi:hypothetical protein
MQNGTKVERQMEKREDSRFVKFAAGDVVSGVLVNIERIAVGDPPKSAIRYTLLTDEGEYLSFLGTYQISTKLRLEDRGHYVEVRCIGEDTMVKRGQNCMKVFDVFVSKTPEKKASAAHVISDGTQINDDDIPF